jgi:alpha-1,6-mannosyltransferase
VSRRRTAALFACGAMLAALTIAGLLLQSADQINGFLVAAGCQSGIYLAAVWLVWNLRSSRRLVLAIVGLALAMRIVVALAPPYLSADIYRYIWDGRVAAAGFNPYRYEPVDPQLASLRDEDIYPQIASKHAPTLYPPLAQAVFFGVTRISQSVTAMQLAMVIFDMITIALLVRQLALERLPTARVLVYAWHPLPVWEFAGSGHIDAVLIACSVAALWAFHQRRSGFVGFFLAGATLTKFYPTILAPALYRRWDWKFPVCFAAAIVVAYLPFLSAGRQVIGFLPGYARQEGFDTAGAGFYLLGLLRCLPALETMSTRFFELSAALVLAVMGAGFAFHRRRERPPYAPAAVLAMLFMVVVSPHYPWYFCWLIVYGCFFRSFALLWLTNACLLLYLATDYVFVPSRQLLAIESAIYGPFAALALVDLWYYHRQAHPRS